jgi:hypothetical protein
MLGERNATGRAVAPAWFVPSGDRSRCEGGASVTPPVEYRCSDVVTMLWFLLGVADGRDREIADGRDREIADALGKMFETAAGRGGKVTKLKAANWMIHLFLDQSISVAVSNQAGMKAFNNRLFC